jgi:Tfp pilus assembly protein PilO
MERVILNTVLRKLEILRYQLGWLGMAGLLALMGCLLLSFTVVMPAQQHLQQKTRELAWLARQPKAKPVVQAPLLNDEQALRKFYSQFPLVTDLSKVMAQIHQLALDKGIQLTAGEYKLAADANDQNLLRYEIIFPVHASYKSLRDFIEEVSLKFPTMGLGEINIKRDSIGDNAAQIKLNYVLLLVRSH